MATTTNIIKHQKFHPFLFLVPIGSWESLTLPNNSNSNSHHAVPHPKIGETNFGETSSPWKQIRNLDVLEGGWDGGSGAGFRVAWCGVVFVELWSFFFWCLTVFKK